VTEKCEPLQYSFRPVLKCDMCKAGPEHFSVMGMRLNRSQGLNPRALAGIAVGVRKCRNCGLIFADPQPLPLDFAAHYGEPDAYWGESYFEADPSYFAKEIAEAKALITGGDKPRALDIGAGIGKAMQALAAAGFDTWGIEPSAAFHQIALKRGIDADRLQCAGVEQADFAAESFDFITFGAVLEHLTEPSASIERALHWLKPGGIVQIEVPSSKRLIPKLVNLYFRLIGTTYVTNISPMHAPFHLFEFGLESFQLNGARLGYEVAQHRFEVCEIAHFPRIVHPPLRWLMSRTDTGMQLTVYLRKNASSRV
jgi:SAM-dependent methyltransferase